METTGAFVTFDCILSEHFHGKLEFRFRDEKLALAAMLAWAAAFLFWTALSSKIRSFGRLHRKNRCSRMKMNCLPHKFFGRLETFRRGKSWDRALGNYLRPIRM